MTVVQTLYKMLISYLCFYIKFKPHTLLFPQTCVRDRAILSILAVRSISKEVAQKAVDEVFESCFNDHEPFGRIPHNNMYARYAHRDFQNRDRYYSNI